MTKNRKNKRARQHRKRAEKARRKATKQAKKAAGNRKPAQVPEDRRAKLPVRVSPVSLPFDEAEPCPCESGNPVSRCCWTDGGRLVPQRVVTSEPAGKGPVEGCYFRGLEACVGKLSREHWLSSNVQEGMTGKNLTVKWKGMDEFVVGKSSGLTSKVLCEGHNHALSPLDSVGGRFFRALGAAPQHLDGNSPARREVRLVNGHDLERWFLKILIGFHAARTKGWTPPKPWLEILLGQREFAGAQGLYVAGVPGYTPTASPGASRVELSTLVGSEDGEPRVLFARMLGFEFQLSLAEDFLMEGWNYRPMLIRLASERGGRAFFQLFGWDSKDFASCIQAVWRPS